MIFVMNYLRKFLRACILISILSLIITIPSKAQSIYFSVKDFGAKGDGVFLDTKAIQQAIDAANQNGGGTVFFPAGKYLSGTVFLKNSVSLYLDAGSEILGSTELENYPVAICSHRSCSVSLSVEILK